MSPQIQFDDEIDPVTSHGGGGVYPSRSRSHTGVGSIRASNQSRQPQRRIDEEDVDIVDDRDLKTKQVWRLIAYGYTGASFC